MHSGPAQRFASLFAALSQPTRLKIVEVVAAGGAEGTPAGQIAKAVRCPASTLSFHLKELSQAGLLNAAPQGRFIRYSVQPDAFASLAAFVSRLPQGPGTATDRGPARSRRKATRRGAKDHSPDKDAEGQLSIFED